MHGIHGKEWIFCALGARLMNIGSGIVQCCCCDYLSLAKVIHVFIVPSSLWAAPTFNLRPFVPIDEEIVISGDVSVG